ncbi:MAG: ATP-binding protein [Proteobacteria bacterium]|nr:ATP-binding protein [Pseudomonadota bacterium]MBU0968935.1 ATP-binding protein [Pseudomonadota bacterium]
MEDFICRENDSSIFCNFSSTLTNIDRVVDTIKNFLHSRRIPFSPFELLFVLREALNNSVIHGNQKDSSLKVDCSLHLDKDTLTITVTDQGKGFDWQRQLIKTPVSSSTTSGRGLNSMERYGFTMRFNEAGNTLYLTKKII